MMIWILLKWTTWMLLCGEEEREDMEMEVDVDSSWIGSDSDEDFNEESGDVENTGKAILMEQMYTAQSFCNSDNNNVEEIQDDEVIDEDNNGNNVLVDSEECVPEIEEKAETEIEDETAEKIDFVERKPILSSWIQAKNGTWTEKAPKKEITGYEMKEDGGYVKIKEEHYYEKQDPSAGFHRFLGVDMRNIRRVLGIMDQHLEQPLCVDHRTKETHPLECSRACPWSGKKCLAAFKLKDHEAVLTTLEPETNNFPR